MQVSFEELARRAEEAAVFLAGPSLRLPLYPALEQRARAGVLDNFARQGTADGSPWPPLKDPKERGRPILVKTGALLASIKSRADAGGVVVYSVMPYAGYQDRGARTIPARSFLGLSQQALDGMALEWAAFAAGAVFR